VARPEIPVPVPSARAALLALALAMVSLACGGDPPPAAPTAAAEKARIERIVVATGTIEPAKEVEVRPRIPGIVEHIRVKEGDQVVAGQVLVEIERELLEAQAQEAAAELEASKVEKHYAEIELGRIEELQKSGAASSQKLDDALARSQNATAGVARSSARLRTLRTQLSYASVLSPLAGRVLSIPVEEGQAVSPVTAVTGGTLLLSLAATNAIHLKGLVDENEVARVAIGQPARIRTEAFGDRVFRGEVLEIAPVGQRNQNVTYFEVKVAVTDPEASLLRPRMSGDAEIIAEVVDGALVVPETALRYRDKDVYVQVANGEAVREQPIKIGIVDGDRVQVLDGLAAGDKVQLQ
jgi:HlyD family secretion protein